MKECLDPKVIQVVRKCIKELESNIFDTNTIYEILSKTEYSEKENSSTHFKIEIFRVLMKLSENREIKCLEEIKSLYEEEPKGLFKHRYQRKT